MTPCCICGRDNYRSPCPHCLETFHKEVAEGRIPEGATKADYTFDDWQYVQETIETMRRRKYDDEKIRAYIAENLRSRIAARKRKAAGYSYEAEQQRQVDQEIRDRKNGIY